MARTEWEIWARLEKIVQEESYMSANEAFTSLKTAVLKADAAELSAQLGQAVLAWEFILGFAAKKPFYRSHLCQVVEALLAQPRWREVYASSQDLQVKAESVHEDVKKALASVPAAPAPTLKPEPKAKAGPNKDVEWPSWDVLQDVVKREAFMGANEEFRVLRLAVLAADEVQLASQVAHAPMVWDFIAGFAARKSHFRSQVAEVVSALRKESGWDAALEAAQPSLQGRLEALPDAVRGQLSRADQSPSSVDDVGEDQHQVPYTSPDFQSLEERLRSMADAVSCVANLAPEAEGEAVPAASAAPEVVRKLLEEPLQPQEGAKREELVSQLLDSVKPPLEDAPPVPNEGSSEKSELEGEVSCLLETVASLEATQPVVAHYLRIQALEMLLAAKHAKQTTAGSEKLLLETFEKAEETKGKLDLTDGEAQLRQFAEQSYERAIAEDGKQGAGSSSDLLAAGLCLEALAQFGPIEPVLAERAAYAKSRAAHLASCLRQQLPPAAPQPPVTPVVRPPPAPAPPKASAPEPPQAPAPPSPAPPVSAPQPSPAAKAAAPAPAPKPDSFAQFAALPPSKRQAEARKKADQAVAAVASGSDDSARALIKEALGLLHGL